MNRPARGALGALLFVSCLAAGCGGGSPTVAVTGRLLDNGEPVKKPDNLPPGDRGVRLSFTQAGGGAAEPQYAQINDDGTFRVDGPNKKGIPPGKYRLTFQRGAMGKQAAAVEIPDVEIPRARSATVEVDVGKKTANVK